MQVFFYLKTAPINITKDESGRTNFDIEGDPHNLNKLIYLRGIWKTHIWTPKCMWMTVEKLAAVKV